jgi:hypothetical protein
VAAAVVGLGLLAVLVALADGRALLDTAAGIQPATLLVPIALTVLSYAAMARSYQGIADAAGAHLSFAAWMRITFVSNTVNYLVTSAGLSGFAVRMLLLKQQGIPSGRCVVISLVQTFLTNFTLLFFILIGFASLLTRQVLHGPVLVLASALVVAFAGVLIYAIVLVSRRRLRRVTLLFLANATHRILRRVAPSQTPRRVRLWRFQHNLNEGFEFLLQRKSRIIGPTAWISLDWVLTMGILWWTFRAVHYPVSPTLVLTGFGVGLFMSLVSFVPGGLGVMEGSMTAVFVSLSVPLESAVVAVLVFRVAYYVVPVLVSVFFFSGVLRQATRGVAASRV